MSNTPNRPGALRYTGDGSLYVRGVPARDLSEADIATLDAVNVQRALMSGLYEPASKTAAAAINKAAANDDKEAS